MKWLQGAYTQRYNGRHQVRGHLFQGRYKAVVAKECPKSLPTVLSLLVYTSQDPVLKKRWISIGHQPLLTGQNGLAKRIVAGDVWLDDQHLGPASEVDRRDLPQMDVLGAGLVEKKAANVTAKQ
jgi:hypothetical protein